jgi:hypothetical protein
MMIKCEENNGKSNYFNIRNINAIIIEESSARVYMKGDENPFRIKSEGVEILLGKLKEIEEMEYRKIHLELSYQTHKRTLGLLCYKTTVYGQF